MQKSSKLRMNFAFLDDFSILWTILLFQSHSDDIILHRTHFDTMKSQILTSVLLLIMPFAATSVAKAKNYNLTSPDGKISISADDSDPNAIYISVSAGDKLLLSPSPIALEIAGIGKTYKVKKSSIKKMRSEHISAPFHHTREYDVVSNDMTLKLDNGLDLEFRIFNDGVAYRFVSNNRTKEDIVTGETAEYNIPCDPEIYLPHSTNKEKPMAMAFQNFYTVTPLSSASPLAAFLPATLDYGDGLKMTILESDLEQYPGMFITTDSINHRIKGIFAKLPSETAFYPWRKQEYVTATENYLTRTSGKRTYPWRIFAITADDTMMPLNNLVYTLASPSRIADTSWIRPGKAAWEWWNDWGLRGVPFKAGINNETYRYFIDFAAENGIEYVVLDEGWYNPKSGDMLTTIKDIDLPMLVGYADKKGVGLWLWTVFNVLDSQLEEACEKYSRMGIKGFKVDFLDRDDSNAVDMTYRIADATARHQLMLDLHGFYKPTGLNRTYPNIVNFESVFGMEEMKWSDPSVDMPEYDVTFPYIRMMCGPVDFTPGAMRNATKNDWKAVYSNPVSQGTRAHQIANYIVQDSPFTMLADSPTNYNENKGCTDFITSLPTVFDEKKVTQGRIGEYIVTVRRSGNRWYAGGQTDWTPRDLDFDFSFLPSDRKFKVKVLMDGLNAGKQAQDYMVDDFTADRDTRRKIHLAPGGGFAMTIVPL